MTAPTITGTPQVGQTLTASIGDIQPPVAYQWNRAGTPISGATSAADVGNIITVTVVTVSPPTAAVIDIIPTNSAVPTILGIAQQGQTLTASHGAWTHNPTRYFYQWANTSVVFVRQLYNMLQLGRVIAQGAALRDESRGAHYKPDFPERDDKNWLKTTKATFAPDADEPRFEFEPVDVSLIPPRPRRYDAVK